MFHTILHLIDIMQTDHRSSSVVDSRYLRKEDLSEECHWLVGHQDLRRLWSFNSAYNRPTRAHRRRDHTLSISLLIGLSGRRNMRIRVYRILAVLAGATLALSTLFFPFVQRALGPATTRVLHIEGREFRTLDP